MNRIVPLILAIALFMEQMDSTVIATALPAIAADLHVGPITLKLALTSYMVALAVFIPISGWMADRFGAKRIFRIAICVFVVGSIFCAASGSLLEFVGSRFLQGVGGSMMTPIGRLVLVRTTKRSDLVSAMALLSIPALVGPLAGPPLGGFITTYFSWHWIFLINVPVGIVGVILATIFLPEVEAMAPPKLDIIGFLLTSFAAAGIVFGMSVISLPALPSYIGISAVVIGFVCGLLYVGHARNHPSPILNLKLLRKPTFRASVTGGILFRICIGAMPFLLPLMLQLGFGLNPFQSGLITFAGAIGAISTKFIAKRVFAAFGFRTALLTAAGVTTMTTIAIGFFEPTTSHLVIIGVLLLGGFSRSFFFTGINALAFADVDDREASQATSMSSVMQQVSLALGVAVAAAILETTTFFSGTSLQVADFHIAFFTLSVLTVIATLPFLRLDRNAGALLSGHGAGPSKAEVLAVPQTPAAE
ncbi:MULTISPECIES: DHA2 family efflux MFS transporter permease subunit [unclassified Rhizobium]|uniref:DHA2 family efflux MFS transporter permease subunit n=1 Tax=unclassified Rhizobium TaxID=2613769 RepID=UPI001ADD1D60|nr:MULTISPECIES: DHA2 family efflux MFS transporter permease subunit [unclassified Rhizobium]MBO9097359.1 DHA2 family efflux MFS transporter permease subunit [Rhizobium sp. L58/93]MBO9133789.1 DHA2 family efflux MFS transporter permease subunit [Rhizobium sp. B209b/85]MBO9167598.1 DHA2 family efflux MFS transporter permease subunit [Rhizobium sp. L245/93]MBO9183557.1 DHA2 family efflux MFS transporter permease subunit [Rhizobium sp. E27B/91]QXZ83885.1 DHA2 family efflux MFS transporter permeas